MATGFFTDTTLCIGCKACEVACKEWNQLPADSYTFTGMSYDNTVALSGSTWRHVAFIEQFDGATGHFMGLGDGQSAGDGARRIAGNVHDWEGQRQGAGRPSDTRVVEPHPPTPFPGREGGVPLARWERGSGGEVGGGFLGEQRWLMMSDVCKHCSNAGCLEACPTGAIIRNEFGDVYVQPDVCNGCGYCQVACPFGVIELYEDGRAWKCTLCYDRQKEGLMPACAKACPTQSIQFGEIEELRERAWQRVGQLHERGVTDAYLYGADEHTSVGNLNAFFLLVDEPAVYNLPEKPHAPAAQAIPAYLATAATGVLLGAAALLTLLAGRYSRHEWPGHRTTT